MSSFVRRLYSPVLMDIFFGALGVFSLFTLVIGSGRGADAIAALDDPLRKGLALSAVLVVSTIVAAFASRADQKCADDFVFMTLAKSALIGMVGLLFTTAFWEVLLADEMGGISGLGMMVVALACWSVGYLYTRIRGTRA